MRKLLLAALLCLGAAGAGDARAGEAGPPETVVGKHMAAQAMLAAHYVAAALEAGKTAAEIDAVLAGIAERSVIGEFWISDESGRIAFSSAPAQGFAFPTDPEAGTQAAPFARLLTGEAAVVAQEARPRELDGKTFKYVGVAGVDGPRIVQVGLPAEAPE